MEKYSTGVRRLRESAEAEPKHSGRGILFLKQCAAVTIIIVLCVLINKSGFNFGKNCLSALARAVRWEFDFGAALNVIFSWLSGAASFLRDIFNFGM